MAQAVTYVNWRCTKHPFSVCRKASAAVSSLLLEKPSVTSLRHGVFSAWPWTFELSAGIISGTSRLNPGVDSGMLVCRGAPTLTVAVRNILL